MKPIEEEMSEYPEIPSDSIYGNPKTPIQAPHSPERLSIAWPVCILLWIVAFLVSALNGCAWTGEKYEEIKSHTIIGIGATKSGAQWYGPITMSWLSEPKPGEVVEADPPYRTEIIPHK